LWTTGSLSDKNFVIRILHKFCDPTSKVLPDKFKCDAEVDNEKNFVLRSGLEDQDSHELIVREDKSH